MSPRLSRPRPRSCAAQHHRPLCPSPPGLRWARFSRCPLFVSFLVCFLFLFFSFVADRFPSGSLSQGCNDPPLARKPSGGWSPFFFESTQLHHAAVTADDVWFGFRSFFGSFFHRSHHSSCPSFFSLVPLACNEEGCPTLKFLFISRVGRALPYPIGTWHSPLHDTPQRRHHACIFSWLGYCTRGILHLSS